MRRHVGLSSLSQQTTANAAYSSLSSTLSEHQLSTLQAQLATFQGALRTFATKHRAKILSDPVFRTHFADMCNKLGVDPLGSGGRKGVWDYLGVGEWTYALAVQVVDVCLSSRERNGGLMELDEVVRGVTRLRGGPAPTPGSGSSSSNSRKGANAAKESASYATTSSSSSVTAQDVSRAINALQPLGCGYSIIDLGHGKKMVRSVAAEFDTDSLTLLEAASDSGLGHLTISSLRSFTAGRSVGGSSVPTGGWTVQRAVNALERALLNEGLVWMDDQEAGEVQYWIPSLFDFQEAGLETARGETG